jgi:peptidoglycan/xylan/chitin deacetylase (PgdA/CDA1 family)
VPVLGYHRVGDGPDPFGLTVSARHFEAHLEVLTRRAHPMRLPDAVDAALDGGAPPRAVALTFDDGYADMLETVLPLLEQARVPATVFVTTGCPGRQFWWDELAAIADEDSTPATLRSRAAGLQNLEPSERERVMQGLRGRAGERAGSGRAPRALTTGELRQVAMSRYVEIGAHTVSHPVLPRLAPVEQRREVQQSRADLETATGAPVRSFSYPHGVHSPETRAIVAEAGFSRACCSEEDVVARRSEPLALPRLWVRDYDGPAFERWLSGWLWG